MGAHTEVPDAAGTIPYPWETVPSGVRVDPDPPIRATTHTRPEPRVSDARFAVFTPRISSFNQHGT